MNTKMLQVALEIETTRSELRALGLNEEEIEGYFEMFLDNYMSGLEEQKE